MRGSLVVCMLLLAAIAAAIGAGLVSSSATNRASADGSVQGDAAENWSTPALPLFPLCSPGIPLVPTAGPYVVFREWIEGDRSSVFVYDVGLGKYWIAVDRIPLREVLIADTDLIVWTGNQILRVGLHGYTKRVLFVGEDIQELRLSPDMSKLAISYGRPLNLVVVEIGSADQLLKVEADDPRLMALRQVGWGSDDNPGRQLRLGEWSAGGDALSLRAGRQFDWYEYYPGLIEQHQQAILSLDGEQSVLPTGWLLSAGLSYALNPGELLTARRFWENDTYLWREFDVVDMENGELLWTINVEQGQGIIPTDPSVWGRWSDVSPVIWGSEEQRLVYFEFGERLPAHTYESLAETAGRAWQDWYLIAPNSGLNAYILDLESGSQRELSHSEWVALEEADDLVSRPCLYSRHGFDCLLAVDEQVFWHGSPRLIGVIEPAVPLVLPGIVLREQRTLAAVPGSRPAGEVVGPLIAYSLQTAEPESIAEADMNWFRRSRLMVHDAGTGRTWPAFDWRTEFGQYSPFEISLVPNGFLVNEDDTVRFTNLEGVTQSILFDEPLRERESIRRVDVSPDGRYVVIELYKDERPAGYIYPGGGGVPASYQFLVVEIKSARTAARIAFNREHSGGVDPPGYTMSWNETGTALGVTEYAPPEHNHWAGTIFLETGEFHRSPAWQVFPFQISPDYRYALLVWMIDRDAYSYGGLRYEDLDAPAQLHVFDFLSEEVVWRSEILGAPTEPRYRGWHGPDQIAWIEGGDQAYLDEDLGRFMDVPEHAVITVANISTGEVEAIPGAEYMLRFDLAVPEDDGGADIGAVVDCPVDREQLCRVLHDGSVIGEGRWLRVIGEIPID